MINENYIRILEFHLAFTLDLPRLADFVALTLDLGLALDLDFKTLFFCVLFRLAIFKL
jgi:hypothetical protein